MGAWVVPAIQATGVILSLWAQDKANRQRQSQYNAQAAEYRRYAEAQYKITQKKMGMIRTQSLKKQDEIQALGQIRAHQIKIQGQRATASISAATGSSGAVVGYGTPGQLEFQQMLLSTKAQNNLKVKTNRQIDIMQDSADLARSSMYAKASWADSAAAATEASRLISGAGTLLTGMGTIAQTQYMMPENQRISYFRTQENAIGQY